MPGLVDDAHAAAAQLAQDLVAGDDRDGPLPGDRRRGPSDVCWFGQDEGSVDGGTATVRANPSPIRFPPGDDDLAVVRGSSRRMKPAGSDAASVAALGASSGRVGRSHPSSFIVASAGSDAGERGLRVRDDSSRLAAVSAMVLPSK